MDLSRSPNTLAPMGKRVIINLISDLGIILCKKKPQPSENGC